MRILSNRPVQILLVLLALGTAFLVGTPLLIRHFAVEWLRDNGGEQVTFQDVDLNPFTGRLVLEGLDVKVDDDTTLSFKTAELDLAWLPLWHKQVSIQTISLNDLIVSIHQQPDHMLIGGIRLPAGGAETPPEPPPEHPWMAGIDTLVLNNIRVDYRDDKLDLKLLVDHLQLEDLAQWTAQTATPVAAAGSLNGAPFTLKGEITPFADAPHYAVTLDLDALQLAAFAKLAQAQLGTLAGKLSYSGTLDFIQQADGFKVAQEGKLQLQDYTIAVVRPPVAVRGAGTQVTSTLDLANAGEAQDLQLKADISLADLDVSADEGRLRLLHSGSLTVSGLNMTGPDNISVASVEAGKLGYARRMESGTSDSPIDIDKVTISALSLSDNLLSIDSIVGTGAHRPIHRTSDGTLKITSLIDDIKHLTEPESPDGNAAEPAAGDKPDKDAEKPPMAVAIGRIEVGGDSVMAVLDESVEPPFKTNIQIKTLSVASLDSRKPATDSPVKIDARIGEHTDLTLDGTIQPFMEPPVIDIKSRISALDLPPLSAYAVQAMGLKLDSGTLDSDIKFESGKDKLDGLIELQLYHLQLKNVESKNSLQNSLPVPINVALDTLRDGNDTISLKIPVEGDPANPGFDINDALTKALAGGVQKGAITYLTLALQPYGAMIAAAKYAGEAATKLRLNPVAFQAGDSALDNTARDYLSKVAKVLAERPKIAVKVCGVAVDADRIQLQQQQAAAAQKSAGKADKDKGQAASPPEIGDEQLRALASARAGTVRDFLVKNFRTPASHLVSCQPRVETGDAQEAGPRADLLL